MRGAGWLAVVAGGLTLGVAVGQTAPDGGQVYTLGSTARLVIEDVLVTDKAGNAVTGLPAGAFHLTDDGETQRISDFSETHGGEEAAATKAPAQQGVFSNAAMKNPGGHVVVLLIDAVGMELPDQIYLRLQMLKYLRAMPEGLNVAVFRNNGMGRPLLVQSLTTDHALLEKAVNHSVPTIPHAVQASFSDAVSEVATISYYLAQMPGRKQLIWCSGKFPLFESPLLLGSSVNVTDRDRELKLAYRLLEKARVEVFPIDVRGVTMGGPPLNPPRGQGSTSVSEGAVDGGANDAMNQMATATGGRAFYSRNDLSGAIAGAVRLGSDSYAVSYHPQPYTADGRWHKVSLQVDGPYLLSYRRGYFAEEGAGSPGKQVAAEDERERKALEAVETSAENPPITFAARLDPQPAGGSGETKGLKGSTTFTVHYGIAASDVAFVAGPDGRQEARFKVAAVALDEDGRVMNSVIDELDTHFSPTQMDEVGRIGIPVDQTIAAGRNASSLLLAVVDLKSGRTGTVQLTVDAGKAGR